MKINYKRVCFVLVWVIFGLFFVIGFADCARAETIEGYDVERLAESIYHAEGGTMAKKPYGILSIPCEGKAHCGRICRNTIRNNLRRWVKNGRKQPYIEFLGAKYAPTKGKSLNGAERRLNGFWVDNVTKLYKAG